MLKKHNKCIGYIDNKPCPYNSLSGDQKCRTHSLNLNIYKKYKYKSTCMLCAEFIEIIQYPCKHNYCHNCIKVNEFDQICPICLSYNSILMAEKTN